MHGPLDFNHRGKSDTFADVVNTGSAGAAKGMSPRSRHGRKSSITTTPGSIRRGRKHASARKPRRSGNWMLPVTARTISMRLEVEARLQAAVRAEAAQHRSN